MTDKDGVIAALGIIGAAIAGLIFIAQTVKAKSTTQPSSSSTSSSSSGMNYIPASQANSIGASAVVGSEVAVSNGAEYTDTQSLQQLAAQQPSFILGINNTAMTITVQGAPTNQVIQVYNLQNGQLIFNMEGDGTTNYTPALSPGTYIAITLNTKQVSNTVSV